MVVPEAHDGHRADSLGPVRWFLLWLLSGTTLVLSLICLVALMVRGRIRHRHRVDHKVQTGAPLLWLVDPRSPARIHRRLVRVGALATAVIADHQGRRSVATLGRRPEPGPVAETAVRLRTRGVEIDRELARVARLSPSARRRPLDELAGEVSRLEEAARELASLSAATLTPVTLSHSDSAVTGVEGQIRRLDEARRELDSLDQSVGLTPATRNPYESESTTASSAARAGSFDQRVTTSR